ncbi:MAG TPA: DUF362 domain-containing protein, partial [Gemmatimonadaceae bacterium]|nr:DUF362 domain-containing protein [Gemmatimonadaceae bacterium]
MSGAGDARVALVRPGRGAAEQDAYDESRVRDAVRRAGALLGWSDPERGAFGSAIGAGERVVVKPNWVLHANQGPGGFEPLVTHGSLVRSVVLEALRSAAGSVVLGDAPVQGCDFEALVERSGLAKWAQALRAADSRFDGPRDFRRTRSVVRDGVRQADEDLISRDQFVLFDLGAESLLEPVTRPDGRFRVTQYDPRQMALTHRPGRHQYLVARAVIEADVVINLPKLKTHKKAGVTCALKNLIGINGNKEFLPHHRVGGSERGGDCYPGSSSAKRALEMVHDAVNRSRGTAGRRALDVGARVLQRVLRLQGDRLGVEGSWAGNDTIWRTCLDLNRILIYGRADGSLADVPQRRVLNVVDAIVAGQGDGPLAPQPLPLGMVIAGSSSAAVDWAGAQLLGYDPSRIPIAHHAFDDFRWPLTRFGADDVQIVGDGGSSGGRMDAALRPD